jgi:hypothetical protein
MGQTNENQRLQMDLAYPRGIAGRRCNHKIPQSKLITFKGGDHYIAITHMDEVQPHIRQFVGSLISDPQGAPAGSGGR